MGVKVKNLTSALHGIESDRQLSNEIVESALKEALAKAYRKQIEIPDAYVRVDIVKGIIHIYHERVVVEEVEDDELEISLEDARKVNKKAVLGDMIDEEVDFTTFDRAAVVLAKNVMKQKIREAEKMQVYEEYCDKVDEMILGTVETVEEKFLLVNIGKTLAMMKKMAQIPTEHYYEGQRLLVVISEVNKETKGAQVLVSRATPMFVRRLFEREVPEIYNGTIEIKAIARDPGERCKIAVQTHNENIDPIGACIGPRGSRVQTIINELNGEKIDIFEWSDNISELIGNALSPSEAIAVIPNPEVKDGLIVVVADSQLSLAIGKRGKNARLAVKLTNRRIDIKSESEMQELGIDYMAIAKNMQEEYEEKKAKEREYKQHQQYEKLKTEERDVVTLEDVDFAYEADQEDVDDDIISNETSLFDKEQEVKNEAKVQYAQPAKKEPEFTSKLDSFADLGKDMNEAEDDKKEVTVEVVVKKQAYDEKQSIYTDEELEGMDDEYEDEDYWDNDVDYEEYDKYYDDYDD